MEELSREDVRALAGEVLETVGVVRAEIGEEEREVIRRAAEDWRRRRDGEKGC